MQEDITLFLNYLAKEKKCSKNTLDAYHNDLSQLADHISHIASRDVAVTGGVELSEEHLTSYMLSLREKSYTVSTIARKVAAARTFIKFMTERGMADSDLSPKLSAPRVNKSLPQALSVLEIKKLLDETGRLPTIDARRDQAMLELLYATGLLASELMSLNVDDVDLDRGCINITNMRGHSRKIPLDKRIQGLMREYIASVRIKLLTSDKQEALFLNQRGDRLTRQGFWQIVQGYADAAGLSSKVTPRTIRHSYAVHRLNNGADLHSIQEVLGHAHVSTTKAYKQV
ncbi:MAG: tyrosine-type recombinase/integrase [Chloroflexi bacterium]|nr:tyrosine-type recombinase/integrase [Chloroflexota bacterium]